MKKYNKKTTIFLIAFLFLISGVFILPAVALNEPKTSQSATTLKIVVTDQQMPSIQNVTDDFIASEWNGAGITTIDVSSSGGNANEQLTFLTTQMSSPSYTYDIIGLDPPFTAQFVENGWIRPLDPYLETGELDAFEGALVDTCTYEGQTWAYPYFLNLGILYYRKDLMDLHFGPGSWSPDDFATWEGLNETANYILNNVSGQLDNTDLVGYVGQLDAYEGGVVNFFEWAGSNGATDLISKTGQVDINNEQVQEAMQFLKDLIPPQYTGVQGTDFIIPRSGLVHDEGSSVGVWLNNNSIFMRQWTFGYGSSISAGMDFGVAALPHFEGATDYKTTVVGGQILAIPQSNPSSRVEISVNFTKFLGTKLAQEAELTSDSSPNPGVQPLTNFPALTEVYDNPPSGFEFIQNWTEQINLTLARPKHPQYSLASNAIADYFGDILSCNKDVETGLAEMEQDVRESLAGLPEEIPGFALGILVLAMASSIALIVVFRKR